MEQDLKLIEEYKQLNELHRFYTSIVLQTVTFALSATGAVVAYVLKEHSTYAAYGFVIPATLCIGMGVGFLINIRSATELRDRLEELTKTLDLGLAPHSAVLINALVFFGLLLTITGVVLFVLLIRSH